MKLFLIVVLIPALFSCKAHDNLRLDTSITYSKTLRLIAPDSKYFEVFKKAFTDGVIDSNEFSKLESIYQKHLVEYEISKAKEL
jgi:hypothetical protein